MCGGANRDKEGAMSSLRTSHGLALQYSGQVGKCFCSVRLVQTVSQAPSKLVWLVEDVIAAAKLRNRTGSTVCLLEVESERWICAGLKAQCVQHSLQSVFLC